MGISATSLTYPGTIADLTVADLDFDFLVQGRHFHLSSLYLQRGLHAGLPDLLRRLKQAGLTISLDTNDDPEDKWGSPLAGSCRTSISLCLTKTRCAEWLAVPTWTMRFRHS